jgi:hypothetical protein
LQPPGRFVVWHHDADARPSMPQAAPPAAQQQPVWRPIARRPLLVPGVWSPDAAHAGLSTAPATQQLEADRPQHTHWCSAPGQLVWLPVWCPLGPKLVLPDQGPPKKHRE